jgi:uncharacterized protein
MATTDHQFIDVFETARIGLRIEGRRALTALPRLAPMLAAAAEDLRFEYQGLRDDRERCAAILRIEAKVPLRCDRCGMPVLLPVSLQSSFFFVQTEAELARIPVDDTDDEPLLGSRRFDLDELVEDELILALPISPRHADCRPTAGASDGDAGEGGVTAPDLGDGRPSPFAVLAGLKPRRH